MKNPRFVNGPRRFPKVRPTLAEKLETCLCSQELTGMREQLKKDGYVMTNEETAAAARGKARLAKRGL